MRSFSSLQLPIYARTLEHFAQDGTAYFARGAWAKNFVQTVNAKGGKVSLDDFRDREALVYPAISWNRDGYELLLANGPCEGGATNLMLAWNLFDAAGGKMAKLFSRDWLKAQLLAFVGTVIETPWVTSRALPKDGNELAQASKLHADAALKILSTAMKVPVDGSSHHSSAIVVVDAEGNIAAGMHTINTFPFGEGIFVDGVPLSSALKYERTPPGQSVLENVSPVIALHDGIPRFAMAQFGVGEFPTDFAVLNSVLTAGVDIVNAVMGPRIGYFDLGEDDSSKTMDHLPPIAVDPRYDRADLCALAAEGWPLDARAKSYSSHIGYVDAVSIIPSAGPHTLRGVPAELLHGLATGY